MSHFYQSRGISDVMQLEILSLLEFWIYTNENTWNTLNQPPRCYYFCNDLLLQRNIFGNTAIKSQGRKGLQLESYLRIALPTIQQKMSHLF
jgi:hypothetical protein